MKPKLLVLASGTETGGGSGFQNLVEASKKGTLDANIVCVASNHPNGGVRQKADSLKIPFCHFPAPWTSDRYKELAWDTDFVALSGWLKLVKGLDSKTTFNIHPGPLPQYGGQGMYGHHVHEAVLRDYQRGLIRESAVSMHFVTEKYDDGPVFFHYPVTVLMNDTPQELQQRVNNEERRFQPHITNLVVQGRIAWDGKSKESLYVPAFYQYLPNAKPQQ